MASSREVKSNKPAPKPSASAAAGAVSGGGAALAEEKKQRQTPPLRISQDLMSNSVFSKLDTKSLAAFAKSSFYAYKQAQPVLDQRAVEKLFRYILTGNLPEIKKMLDINSRLALVRRMPGDKKEEVVRNKAGQCIAIRGKTGYMLALGEEDTEIAAMFKAAILRAADEKEALTQYKAQLPDGCEKAEEKRWAPVFDKADAAFKAAIDLKPGDVVSSPQYKLTVKPGSKIDQSLTQWISSCKDILNEPVTTGRHFNPNLAQKVFQTYDDTLEKRFGNDWVDPRALVCWQRIVGRMECLFPANYTQASCDGFYSTAEKLKNGTPQARSFRLEVYDHSRRAWGWVDDVTAPAVGASVLGVDFALGVLRGLRMWGPRGARGAAEIFSNLMSVKNSLLTELMLQHRGCRSEPTKSSCVIM